MPRALSLSGENPLEGFTTARPVISTDHEYIHEKKAFRLVGKSASIGAGASWNLSFTTPAATTGYIHWRPSKVTSTANLLEVSITEGETAISGSAVTPQNRNRVGTVPASTVTAIAGSTCTPSGTVIGLAVVGSGGNATTRQGGASGEDEEIVLKPATTYNIAFNNIGSTAATVAYYDLNWYEEPRGE